MRFTCGAGAPSAWPPSQAAAASPGAVAAGSPGGGLLGAAGSPAGLPPSGVAAPKAAWGEPQAGQGGGEVEQLMNASLLADRNQAFELFRKSYRQNEVRESCRRRQRVVGRCSLRAMTPLEGPQRGGAVLAAD